MSIVFIVKSTIRNKQNFYRFLEEFRSFGHIERIEVKETQKAGHAISLAFQSCNEGFEYVIAVGGDGTLNEVINGVLSHPHHVPCIALLPYGSGNDFSRMGFGFHQPQELMEALRKQKRKTVDIPVLRSTAENTESRKMYYVNMLDAGIGGVVSRKVNRSKKRLGVGFSFFTSILSTFLTYSTSRARIVLNGKEVIEKKILMVAVANGISFGNGLIISPDSRPDDGKLNVIVFGDVSVWLYLKYLPKIRKGIKIEHPEISYHLAQSISVEPISHSLSVEYDGEFGGYAPLKVELNGTKIDFLVPVL